MTRMAHIPHVDEMIKVKWIQIIAELFKKKWRIIATPCVGICRLRYRVHQTRPVELPTLPEQHTDQHPQSCCGGAFDTFDYFTVLVPSLGRALSSNTPPNISVAPHLGPIQTRKWINKKLVICSLVQKVVLKHVCHSSTTHIWGRQPSVLLCCSC